MKTIHTFKDGFKLVNVIDRVEIRKLGRQMRHCTNKTYNYDNKFFFLLDDTETPISLGCVLGDKELDIRESRSNDLGSVHRDKFMELIRLGVVPANETYLAKMGFYSFPDKLIDMIKAECNVQDDSFIVFDGKTYFNDNVYITLKEG